MSQNWHVLAQTEELTSIVYCGDELSCKQLAANLVGMPLRTEAASGAMVVIGTVLSAWVVPAPSGTIR